MRTIMLIDMDYFFVACEELRRPEIIGRPAIVGADPKEGKGRGVVSTCSYEARKYGIRSGMPISTAYRLMPDAFFMPVDDTYYEEVSGRIFSIVKEYAARMEQVSVDEAFIDVSGKVGSYDDAAVYAGLIKGDILKRVGLKCSIGIGPNKLIAKMACESAKPNGIRLVKENEVRDFLSGIRIGDMHGVGGKTEARLNAMGYKTLGDIAASSPVRLFTEFGAYGLEIHRNANGIDDSEVVDYHGIKSIGREKTFDSDTKKWDEISNALRFLSGEVFDELRRKGMAFRTVTVKIRYSDFTEHLKSASLVHGSQDMEGIAKNAVKLFNSSRNGDKSIRKIGVRVSGLIAYKGQKKISSFMVN